eukprot:4846554-Pyramimonas_sp.AAC.1
MSPRHSIQCGKRNRGGNNSGRTLDSGNNDNSPATLPARAGSTGPLCGASPARHQLHSAGGAHGGGVGGRVRAHHAEEPVVGTGRNRAAVLGAQLPAPAGGALGAVFAMGV